MTIDELGDRTIILRRGPAMAVLTVDQTRLPKETVVLKLRNDKDIAHAIRTLKVRGAPLLGATAAFALALEASNSKAKTKQNLLMDLERVASAIRATRPTAVNLFWALDRILDKAREYNGDLGGIAASVADEAQRIADEDVTANHVIGARGAELVQDGDVLLTHCNAGALATVAYGTALGVVRAAKEQGKKIRVVVTETRPLLQGARLTTYELKREDVPVTLITDNMVGYVMAKRLVNKVIVGADRIVKDAVINKIGTFTIAVLAKEHKLPFYVAAPNSTFDLTHTSSEIPIEQRDPNEVTYVDSHRIAAENIDVLNPAFDVTPLEYVTAIICESGILYKEDFSKFTAGHRD